MYSESWSEVAHGMQTLKLFSLGLRLMMMLNVSYGSSVPLWILLVMSCWYWFGSSHTRNVLLSPLSLGFGSGPIPEWTTKYGHFHCFFFKLTNTEGAGAIKYLWKKDWHGERLKYSPHRREPFCSFQIPWQIFFKQDTEREVKVNPTGLFCERLSGVYVGVCNCARVYGYVEMCQIPLLKWVWQSRYTLNTTGATMWTTGPRILEHESLYKSHSKVKTNIPHWSGLWQGMLYSSKGSWKLPPSTFWI